jgi:hypothetical protein
MKTDFEQKEFVVRDVFAKEVVREVVVEGEEMV